MMKVFIVIIIIYVFVFVLKKKENPKINVDNLEIVLINLERSKDRLKEMQKKLPFEFKRVEAVDGKTLDLRKLNMNGLLTDSSLKDTRMSIYNKKQMTPGALGCYLSHMYVWEDSFRNNKNILVLEDDIITVGTKKQFFKKLNQFLEDVPKDWDIIYLGYHDYRSGFVKKMPINMNQEICRLENNVQGTHAYIINRRGAQKLLKDAKPIKSQVDDYMNKKFGEMNVYGCSDSLKFFGYSQYETLIQR